ncbi:hypothetical protein [Corallococcus exercitus]|uniref:PIN domain-containing protein n=1 Tax=Corallococcus exercitus TaxID=2316736 RepID=A0A7Y4JPU8_9BACT|nr:hypothetical protein [Corallococcus exercitus]NOK08744.1 hypothetical protein [Corallococcus exercitus]
MNAYPALCVVDTNVPLTANNANTVSPTCVQACVQAINAVTQSGCIVLDDRWRIINEYKHKLSPTGQPGVGDRFLKWVLTNQANPERCARVSLTPRRDDPRDFEEFPRDPALADFDPADRKFVAASCAHEARPPILQATDSKWWGLKGEFERCRIRIHFLCPRDIEELHERQVGK